MTECAKEKEAISLYEYFHLSTGFRPPDGQAAGMKRIDINSPIGKQAKRTVDVAVGLMETMTTQKFDGELASVVLDYLSEFAEEKAKPKRA